MSGPDNDDVRDVENSNDPPGLPARIPPVALPLQPRVPVARGQTTGWRFGNRAALFSMANDRLVGNVPRCIQPAAASAAPYRPSFAAHGLE